MKKIRTLEFKRYAKANTLKPSVTESLATDMTHAENSKTQLFTKEMVERVILKT